MSSVSVYSRPWFWLMAAVVVVWGVTFGLRMVELALWKQCDYCQVDEQWLLATHDAYFWLAGAEETARSVNQPMPRLVRMIHKTTGAEFSSLGFWLPTLLAPMAVIPLVLLAFRWKIPEAALPFGILAAGCFGYMQRTRLGYLDDDPLALFFPVALGVALVFWLTPLIRDTWFRAGSDPDHDEPATAFWVWLGAVGLGLLFRVYMWAYGTAFPIAASMILVAGALALLLARPGLRITITTGLAVLALSALAGWLGLAVAVGLLILARVRPGIAASGWLALGVCAALFAFLLLGGHSQALLWRMIRVVLIYANLVEPLSGGGAGLAYPSAMETIREAVPASLDAVFEQMAGHWVVAVPALLGYAWLVWKRPAALVFLPLLGLAFAAFKLGNRFTMYGGIPIGLGFGFLLACVLDRLRVRSVVARWGIVLGLTLAAMYPVYSMAAKFHPRPILSPPMATALMVLEKTTPDDARLWQWWDYGYAAQYFARRHTFGDGGRQHGPWLFPLALVHATDSPLQARQMMLLMAESFNAQEQVQKDRENEGEMSDRGHLLDRHSVDPGLPFAGMSPETAQGFVAYLGEKELEWPTTIPPQYLLLAWDNMGLAHWISTFGSQDLSTGERSPGRLQLLGMRYEIREDGLLYLPDQTLPLSSLTVIRGRQGSYFEWPRPKVGSRQAHVLFFEDINQTYLLDEKMRYSMMLRLLIDEPSTVAEHFELVYDNFPWARVYRVRN